MNYCTLIVLILIGFDFSDDAYINILEVDRIENSSSHYMMH